ncbi:MAG: hypothetical protein NTZ83_01045 [Candidatus Pacearchaeota archaeon]|nr:hypothetical protein [Candidatus Pacearchaeota archaeon]
MNLKQIPKTDLDYVILYAEKLKENPKFFVQQKELIDSQLTASSELTKKRFSKTDFKNSVRKHLREIVIIQ